MEMITFEISIHTLNMMKSLSMIYGSFFIGLATFKYNLGSLIFDKRLWFFTNKEK